MKYFLFVLLAWNTPLSAQDTAPGTLEKLVNQLTAAKSVQYEELTEAKSFFSNDTSASYARKRIFFDDTGNVASAEEYYQSGEYQARKVFSDRHVYYMEEDSSYSEREEEHYIGNIGDLFAKGGLMEAIKKTITYHPENISRLKDTIIDKKYCHYYEIKASDTIIDGERSFTYIYIALENKSCLPVASIYKGYSVISKGGKKVGSFDLFSQSLYKKMRLNIGKNDLIAFKVPGYYHPQESVSLLKEGTMAPAWKGTDTQEKEYSSKDFQGKVLLLFLSDIGCPANQMSIAMLNNLADKYQSKNFQIIGIYPESKSRLENYIRSNNLKFTVLYDGKAIKKEYHAPGAPYFYVIDQTGKIIKSVVMYSDDWQQMFTEVIDAALSGK